MPIEMSCKQCGAKYVPSRKELIAGPALYRYCPGCRPVPVRPAGKPVTI